jgi:hypothetical protein
MQVEQCKQGATVWATCGSYGWASATILDCVPTRQRQKVSVAFDARSQIRHGYREPEQLAPRDPKQRGKDKPTPEDAHFATRTR